MSTSETVCFTGGTISTRSTPMNKWIARCTTQSGFTSDCNLYVNVQFYEKGKANFNTSAGHRVPKSFKWTESTENRFNLHWFCKLEAEATARLRFTATGPLPVRRLALPHDNQIPFYSTVWVISSSLTRIQLAVYSQFLTQHRAQLLLAVFAPWIRPPCSLTSPLFYLILSGVSYWPSL
jgi:hypothetical protein